ncbi:MAG: MopE-related protein, partial [Myxococcota bacterium]
MIPLLLAGCLFLTERDLQTVSDADGDGFLAASVGGDDCDDTRADVHPGAGDAWYDGIDGDCDGASDFDQDGDGLDAAAYGGLDCDDTRRSIRADPTDWFPDCDGDGFGDPTPVNSCGLPRDAAALVCSGAGPTDWIAGSPDLQLDCDDTDPAARPYGPDQPYDGIDGDCDGANDWDADHDGWVRPEDAAFAGGTAPNVGDCDDTDATANPATLEIAYDGVDGDCDGGDDYDQDGDGYRPAPHNGTAPADCNDQDASIHPGVPEVWYDGVDDDCDGTDDDQDGDGAGRLDDCDDLDPTVFPGATEVWYDGADQDCDGANDYDRDGDGFVALGEAAHAGGTAPGVGDCDDGDPTARPGAAEVWYDGVDRDCSGGNDFDQDGDGVVASGYDAEAGGLATGDCDDLDASVRPGVPERWYDGVDGDCDGSNDYDRDGDGAVIGGLGVPGGTAVLAGDCDDDDPLVGPGATEVFYDGVDSDCAGDNDYDADGDGFVPDAWAAEAGGTAPFTGDCDDADAAFHPLAPEVWYDGLDQDCAGGNDYDRDGDGFVALAWAAEADGLGTGDCQDGDPAVRPDATEIWYDGLDQDCDGADDFDQDADGTALGQGDCDDTDPAFGPDAVDVPYDGIDHDCAGDNDYDADHDGAVALGFEAEIGGTAPRTGDCD